MAILILCKLSNYGYQSNEYRKFNSFKIQTEKSIIYSEIINKF
jgi:hypothetical protein